MIILKKLSHKTKNKSVESKCWVFKGTYVKHMMNFSFGEILRQNLNKVHAWHSKNGNQHIIKDSGPL